VSLGDLALIVAAGLAGPLLAASRRVFVPVVAGELLAGVILADQHRHEHVAPAPSSGPARPRARSTPARRTSLFQAAPRHRALRESRTPRRGGTDGIGPHRP